MQIRDAADATGHLFPPFAVPRCRLGVEGEETRLNSRRRDHKRGVSSCNIPLDVWDKRAQAGETRRPNLGADGRWAPRAPGERVFAGGVRITESFSANSIVLMAQKMSQWRKISLTYKHNVLDLCVIVFARPKCICWVGGQGGGDANSNIQSASLFLTN